MRMKSVSFQGISVLKTALCYMSSRKLLEAAAFLRPAFGWGFLLNSSGYPCKGEHAILCLLDCWAWLSKMCVICDLKNLVIVYYFFWSVEINRSGISLLKEGSCFVWVGVCGNAGLVFTVVVYVTILCSVNRVSFPPRCGLVCSIFFSRLANPYNGWYQNFVLRKFFFLFFSLFFIFSCSSKTFLCSHLGVVPVIELDVVHLKSLCGPDAAD